MYSLLTVAVLIGLVIYYFVLLKGNKDISFDLKRGFRCYICKEDLKKTHEETYSRLISDELVTSDKWVEACTCCKRDESIDLINGSKKKHYINKFKKFLLSDKSKKFTNGILIVMLITILINLVTSIGFKIYLSALPNFFNILFWTLMVIKIKFQSVKKYEPLDWQK